VESAVVVANAPWRWFPAGVSLVRGAGIVLAADGGANHLARIGVRPAAVVGDLDSILPSVRAWVGEERMVERADQDLTDLHKTIAHAFDDLGLEGMTVLAATGGRLDHAVENLALLGRVCSRGAVQFVDETTRIVPVRGQTLFATHAGQTVSLVPLGRCEAVRTRGLRWALDGEPLDLLDRTGVSNIAEGEQIEVAVTGGTLLVFLHRETLPVVAW
jgi:thiamine pyrophosphokinase